MSLSASSEQSWLFILASLTGLGGGIEAHDRDLVSAIARLLPRARLTALLGREVPLVAAERLDPETRARLHVLGAAGRWRTARAARLVTAAAWATVRTPPDVIVCGHLHYAALAATLAAARGARLIIVAHGVEAWRIRSRLTCAAVRRADLLLAVSGYTGRRVCSETGLPPARVAVVPNAVDTVRFAPGPPDARVAARLAHLPAPRLLTVARLDADERYKGVDRVIAALGRLHRLRRPASFVVVGDGSDRARLETLARAAPLPVSFWGRATDEELPELYRACDLFVMPSSGEGFGRVFVEALASGLPVVAGGRDGSVDALADGALGLLVDPDDVEAIARAIASHLDGASPPALRDPARLRAEAVARFSTPVVAQKLAAALSGLTAAGSDRRGPRSRSRRRA
jgi:glycosyltransferase involved in cell wall biosynthesis